MCATPVRVLIVESDEPVRTGLRLALESADMQISETSTVADGLRSFHETPADVVIVDLDLPDGTASDLIRWLWRRVKRPPIILTSTDFGAVCPVPLPPQPPSDSQMLMLAKPFSAKAVIAAIQRLMAQAGGSIQPPIVSPPTLLRRPSEWGDHSSATP